MEGWIGAGLLLFAIETDGQVRGGFSGRLPAPTPPTFVAPPMRSYPQQPGHFHEPFRHPKPDPAPIYVPYPVYVGNDVGADNPQPPPEPAEQPSYSQPLILPAIGNSAQPEPPAALCPLPQQAEPPPTPVVAHLFIAAKNYWVFTAVAYWVQGDTLHYITPRGIHNQISLSLVDRKKSAELNSGNLVELVLPGQ
jgi:hypothetical protein